MKEEEGESVKQNLFQARNGGGEGGLGQGTWERNGDIWD